MVQTHYVTTHGGPPNGGRPPGMHGGFPGHHHQLYHPSPPPPPPYTPQPTHFCAPIVSHPYFAMPPPPPPTPPQPIARKIPVMYYPVAFHPPPPHAPPIDEAPKDLPGAKLDGANITFNDGTSSYIFPEKHTVIHFMGFEHQPWHQPGSRFKFTKLRVPCVVSIKELIRRLGCPGSEDAERGIIECINQGGGRWLKGSVFKLSEDKSKQTLEEVGWTESRGTTREPTWLAVYKP